MIKLVMTDLDDTLISHDAGQENASPRALDAIRELLDAGVHFGPVSGRTPSSMEGMFCGYEPAYATGAFSNGQIVSWTGRSSIVSTARSSPCSAWPTSVMPRATLLSRSMGWTTTAKAAS